MKKKTVKKSMTAILSAALMMGCGGLSVQAQVNIGKLGGENNLISEPVTEQAEGDVVALDDLGISVTVSDYVSIKQDEGFVYVYTIEPDSIPYVIIGRYDGTWENFASAFTEYMSGEYDDLKVTSEAEKVEIQGKEFTKIEYSYTVSSYTVQDTRLFFEEKGKVYMFGAKEIPEIDYCVGEGYLEKTAGSFAYLAGGDSDYEKHVDSTRSVTNDISSRDTTTGANTIGGSGNVGSIKKIDQNAGAGSIVFSEDTAKFEGTWVVFEDGFKLYLPSYWNEYIVSDEQQQQGVLYMAGDASGAENAPLITVVWCINETAETTEDIAEELSAAGFQVDDLISINGIDCVAYRQEEADCSAVMFFHPMYKEYIFCVTGTPYTENVDMIACILTSLSPSESE